MGRRRMPQKFSRPWWWRGCVTLAPPLHRAVHKHAAVEPLQHILANVRIVQAKSAPVANEALQHLLWMPDVTDLPSMLLEPGSLPLLLDLNDANQTFEVLHGHTTSELRHAPATIVPTKPKVRSPLFPQPDVAPTLITL